MRELNKLAFRLDLLRTLGVGHATRRVLANSRHHRALRDRRQRVPDDMWREAAAELGADVRELAPMLLEFRLGQAVTRVRGQTTPFADPISEAVASDKPVAYRVLAEAGVPVPRHELAGIGQRGAAEQFLVRTGGPCVVKPARGRGGSGITGEVRTAAQMRRALVSAGRFDRQAIIEQQYPGDSYRLLILDGEILDIIKRPRPRVVGDGRSTIEALMFRQYDRRIKDEGPSGLKPLSVDLDCLFTLEQSGHTVRDVLAPGASVTIKTVTNYNGPEECLTVPPPYPEVMVTLARRAAAALAVRLGGVDLVADEEANAVVLEVNAIPGLTHHYNVADAVRAQHIAVPILASLLQAGAGSGPAPGP
jgi:D-alanine-D-alanine ligase-like ATP-grasp enzyme